MDVKTTTCDDFSTNAKRIATGDPNVDPCTHNRGIFIENSEAMILAQRKWDETVLRRSRLRTEAAKLKAAGQFDKMTQEHRDELAYCRKGGEIGGRTTGDLRTKAAELYHAKRFDDMLDVHWILLESRSKGGLASVSRTPEFIIVNTLISTHATIEELSDLTTFTKLRKFLTDYQLPLKYGGAYHYKSLIASLQLSLKRGLPRRVGSSVLKEVAMTDEEIMVLWNHAKPSADGVDMMKLW